MKKKSSLNFNNKHIVIYYTVYSVIRWTTIKYIHRLLSFQQTDPISVELNQILQDAELLGYFTGRVVGCFIGSFIRCIVLLYIANKAISIKTHREKITAFELIGISVLSDIFYFLTLQYTNISALSLIIEITSIIIYCFFIKPKNSYYKKTQ